MISALAERPVAVCTVTAELADLVRSLARTFGRAQRRLAVRQEELLSALRNTKRGDAAALAVRLPDGSITSLSPLDLCTKSRGYLQDMVVDLRCRIESVQTTEGHRLALRLLSDPALKTGCYPMQLCFSDDNPIKAELRFAGEILQTESLYESDLPSQEDAARTQRASVFLLDDAQAAQVERRAIETRKESPSPRADDEDSAFNMAASPFAVPQQAAAPVILVRESEQTESEQTKTEQTESKQRPITRERDAGDSATSKPERSFEPTRRDAPVREAALSHAAPDDAAFLAMPATSLTSRQRLQRMALAGLFGLALTVLIAAVSYGPQLVRPLLSMQVEQVEQVKQVIDVAPLDVAPSADSEGEPAPAENRPAADAGTSSVDTSLIVRFYTLDKDGVKTVTCDGKGVTLTRSASSPLRVARVLLRSGSICKATGAGTVRVYSYQELASDAANDAGEHVRHIRFHKRR